MPVRNLLGIAIERMMKITIKIIKRVKFFELFIFIFTLPSPLNCPQAFSFVYLVLSVGNGNTENNYYAYEELLPV